MDNFWNIYQTQFETAAVSQQERANALIFTAAEILEITTMEKQSHFFLLTQALDLLYAGEHLKNTYKKEHPNRVQERGNSTRTRGWHRKFGPAPLTDNGRNYCGCVHSGSA